MNPFALTLIIFISIGVGGFTGYKIQEYITNVLSDNWEFEHPVAAEFLDYLEANPQLRFWQALANWSEHNVYAVSIHSPHVTEIADTLRQPQFFPLISDTWEWQGRYGRKYEDVPEEGAS